MRILARILNLTAAGLLILSASAAGQSIEVEYDKFKDTTTVKTDGYIDGDPFYMLALYKCEGDQLCSPNNVYVAFATPSDDLEYQDDPTVIFLLDGETRVRHEAVNTGRTYESGTWIEIIQVSLSPTELGQLVSANEVEYQIKSTSAVLTDDQKVSLTGLYEKLEAVTTGSSDG